ncbi:MAG: hypothetical protein KAR25_02450 [Methanosarcinales archaeon]|nr:hypothetical protein [Methanosarcinales archaeon]
MAEIIIPSSDDIVTINRTSGGAILNPGAEGVWLFGKESDVIRGGLIGDYGDNDVDILVEIEEDISLPDSVGIKPEGNGRGAYYIIA